MSLHHVFVAMETFQSDFVDVTAAWLSRTDLNRPQRLYLSLTPVFVPSPNRRPQQGFSGQTKRRRVRLWVGNKRKENNNSYSPFSLPVRWQRSEVCVCVFCPQAARNVSNTHRWSPAEVAGGRRTECWWESWKERARGKMLFYLLHIHVPGGGCVNRRLDAHAPDRSSHGADSKEIKHTHTHTHMLLYKCIQ